MGRVRVSVDVTSDLRRKIRLAALRRDVSITEYVREALARKVAEDLVDALHAADDPVLAEVWGDAQDDAYDHL